MIAKHAVPGAKLPDLAEQGIDAAPQQDGVGVLQARLQLKAEFIAESAAVEESLEGVRGSS
ncbi:MAG: hypothetical protein HS107_11825 [Thermoflexaceae bacterium]|nr:hypothetical protein [Thermoflexaceae bacterium]